MEPFPTEFSGIVAPMDKLNVDTDQIIPKQFLKRVSRTGFGQYLFYDWRYDEEGEPIEDFVLNQAPYDRAEVMLCGENFGCGSSREHAPWALEDFGIKVLISPSFADIFYNNCFKNGMLPIELDAEVVDDLFDRVESADEYVIDVDLNEQVIEGSDGFETSFDIDSFRKKCLLEGLDDIDLTLQHEDKIEAFEQSESAPTPPGQTNPEAGTA
jgi:3-isopropylmalate/(R)-2-methylmalate dehydratase small subunit